MNPRDCTHGGEDECRDCNGTAEDERQLRAALLSRLRDSRHPQRMRTDRDYRTDHVNLLWASMPWRDVDDIEVSIEREYGPLLDDHRRAS